MTDEQLFFAVLVCFYAAHCVLWVRLDAVVLRPRSGGRRALAQPSEQFASAACGLVVLRPVPLRGGALVCRRAGVALSPRGICETTGRRIHPGATRRESAHWLAFDALREARAENGALFLNGRRFAEGLPRAHAEALARRVGELGEMTPEERAASIEREQRAAFDLGAIRDLLERQADANARLAPWCNALFAGLFVAVPALVSFGGVVYTAPWLVLAVVPAWIGATAAFARAHRRLHPERRRERWMRSAHLASFPPELVRAQDVLGRELLAGFEPLAVVLAACEVGQAGGFARRVLLDALHPSPLGMPEMGEDAREGLAWSRALYLAVAREAVGEAGFEFEELVRAPGREAGCVSFCPRCERQHVAGVGECYECGVGLVVFES